MKLKLRGVPNDSPAYTEHDLTSAFGRVQQGGMHRTFIIGGATLYNDALALLPTSAAVVDRVLLTRIIEPDFACDVFMPDFLSQPQQNWQKASHEEFKIWAGIDIPEGIQEENGVQYEFQMWTRREVHRDVL